MQYGPNTRSAARLLTPPGVWWTVSEGTTGVFAGDAWGLALTARASRVGASGDWRPRPSPVSIIASEEELLAGITRFPRVNKGDRGVRIITERNCKPSRKVGMGTNWMLSRHFGIVNQRAMPAH
jgi:hypothetical protein